MAKSLDKVLQPDGTSKWELVEPGLSERMGNDPGTVCPTPEKLVPGELAIDETAPEKGILTANLKTMTKLMRDYFVLRVFRQVGSRGQKV